MNANGVTWYSDGYLPLIPPPFPPNCMENLHRRVEDVLNRRPKCKQQSIAVAAQNSQSKPPENIPQPLPSPGIPPPPSPVPCAESDLLGGDQIESEVSSLEALVDDEAEILGEMKPKRTCCTLKPLQSAGPDVKVPEQPRLLCREMRPTTVGDCRYAKARGLEQGGSISLRVVVGVQSDKSTNLVALQEFVTS